jgi:hypothetical protein
MELRYLGFDQLQNARAFRFEMVVKGEAPKPAIVTVDMSLFLQFHVGIQDGPSLCAAKLTADFDNRIEGDHTLTCDDLRSYSESRAAAEQKRIESRRTAGVRHKPGAAVRAED